MLRTHTCGELSGKDIGKEVTLAGWVSTRRDHGNIIFIDLRDRYGITQIVFNPEQDNALHKQAGALRDEYVIQARGIVRQRPEGTVNKKIFTGGIEVAVSWVKTFNASKAPVLPIADDCEFSDDIRYTYRYLDLRRPRMQRNLLIRDQVSRIMRDVLNEKGFIEVETPVLTRSTPEGARDYLVPSRVNRGRFFALPQSPQLFKQILMVAGIDKYFQIARCFRDEDLRADRQPEFTQLDLEASFIDEGDIFAIIEALMKRIFKDVLGVDLKTPFDILSHKEAMSRYGCDKPDRRFDMGLIDLTDELRETGLKVFSDVIHSQGVVKALRLKGPKDIPRSRIDELTAFVKGIGLKGLAYLKVAPEALSGPIAKFFSDKDKACIKEKTGAQPGDYIFFAASKGSLCNEALSRLRLKLAREYGLIDEDMFDFLWIKEFPLFKRNDEENRWEPEHHPFTAPHEDDIGHLSADPGMMRSRSYDLVLNGMELGSGSIRIHDKDLQDRIFDVIGIDKEEALQRFGFLTKALGFGAPPHGGFAAGLDRLAAILCGCDSIRDVIAFPKTQKAVCPLTQAPSGVSKKQLDELGLGLKKGL
jgi:aspartyl-tRNA synthetase